MADEPTIEKVAAAKAALKNDMRGSNLYCMVSVGHLRTLLTSHASLEERVKEAKRLMEPFVEDLEGCYDDPAIPDTKDSHGWTFQVGQVSRPRRLRE